MGEQFVRKVFYDLMAAHKLLLRGMRAALEHHAANGQRSVLPLLAEVD
jgi:hypothetical protein